MANLSEFMAEAPVWVSGRTYAVGQVVRDPADWYFRYVRVAGGAGTTNPINDPGSWRPDGGRPIKSIQRGTITIPDYTASSASVTISAVNTSKAELRYLGGFGQTNDGTTIGLRIALVNSTTIQANYSAGFGYYGTVSWELTEYY